VKRERESKGEREYRAPTWFCPVECLQQGVQVAHQLCRAVSHAHQPAVRSATGAQCCEGAGNSACVCVFARGGVRGKGGGDDETDEGERNEGREKVREKIKESV
jgi:hypothetical protein